MELITLTVFTVKADSTVNCSLKSKQNFCCVINAITGNILRNKILITFKSSESFEFVSKKKSNNPRPGFVFNYVTNLGRKRERI